MLESPALGWRCGGARVATVVVFAFLLFVGGAYGSPQQSNQQSKAEALAIPSDFPLTIGMTWDECVPILKTRKRLTPPAWQTPNRYSVDYKIGGRAYSLTFERLAPPEFGPYRIVKIDKSTLPPPGPSATDISRQLKLGTTMTEALPLMQRIGGPAGGFFVLETRDRFAAVLQADDGTNIRLTFERPNNVRRPDLIADATPEVLRRMNHVPLNALPELGEYRLTVVKRNDPQ